MTSHIKCLQYRGRSFNYLVGVKLVRLHQRALISQKVVEDSFIYHLMMNFCQFVFHFKLVFFTCQHLSQFILEWFKWISEQVNKWVSCWVRCPLCPQAPWGCRWRWLPTWAELPNCALQVMSVSSRTFKMFDLTTGSRHLLFCSWQVSTKINNSTMFGDQQVICKQWRFLELLDRKYTPVFQTSTKKDSSFWQVWPSAL